MLDSKEKKDQYLNSMRTQLSGVSPQNENGGDGLTDDSQDYYSLLKNEAYKTMLKGEIQAYNAKEQALKYTNNSLMANGYGTQGLGESARVGISNTYAQALRESQDAYDNSILNINSQQSQVSNDDFQSLATLLNSSSSTAQLNEILGNYGYLKDGQWTDEFAKLDTRTQNQIKSLYSLYSSEFENSEWLSNNTINGVGYKDAGSANANITTLDGNTGNVKNEIQYIFQDSYINKVQQTIDKNGGDYCVKLVNGHDNNQYVYMIYRNGAWYQTTASVYNKAQNKEELKGK